MTASLLYTEIIESFELAASRLGPEPAPASDRSAGEDRRSPGYQTYGLRVADVRSIITSYRTQLRALSDEERLALAREFFRTGYEEHAQVGIALQQMSLDAIRPEAFAYVDEIMSLCTCWSTCDSFALNVMQPLLERHPDAARAVLRWWSRTGNVWKRRASLVTLVRKVAESGVHVDLIVELCDNLWGDADDLVQKAVGWVLKDSLRGNRRRTLAHIKRLRRNGAPSAITLAAIRDLTATDREAVLRIKPRSRKA